MSDDIKMPTRIWANPVVFGDSEPLCGEWNYCDTHSPDDTVYIREDVVDNLIKPFEEIRKPKYGLQGIIEDHSDANAFNYEAMKYWRDLAQSYQQIARKALKKLEEQLNEK